MNLGVANSKSQVHLTTRKNAHSSILQRIPENFSYPTYSWAVTACQWLEDALNREDESCSASLGALRCIFSRLAQRKCCSRQLKAVQIRDLRHCWLEEDLWSVQVRSRARWCSLGCGGRLRCFTGSQMSQHSHVSPWNIVQVLLCSSPVQSGTWLRPPELFL